MLREVWLEACSLLLRWEEITVQIGQAITNGEVLQLASLLQERQGIANRLDALKTENGIVSWTADCSEGNLSSDVRSLREKARQILQRLAAEDEQVRLAAQQKIGSLKDDINHLQQTKAALISYRNKRPPRGGAFIDTRK
jgi:hypothetical protein